MFFLSLGIFLLVFTVYILLTSILWIQVSDCIEDKGLYCSASLLGRPLYYFIPKPEYWPRHLGWLVQTVVIFWKYSFRSHYPDICLGWRIYGPWRGPAFCGKDKGLTAHLPQWDQGGQHLLQVMEEAHGAPLGSAYKGWALWTVDPDLGNKAMLANLSFTLAGKRKSQI